MKKLFIIRHAKSSWGNPQLRDFDRPLNSRGENDAPLMGKVLGNKGYEANLIISSPANRAITTARTIANAIGYPVENIVEEQNIYGAGPQEMLDLINQTNDEVESLFLFGHNPTFTFLAEMLSEANIGNLPTCGVVGIEFEYENWTMVTANSGHCFYYDFPKNHK